MLQNFHGLAQNRDTTLTDASLDALRKRVADMMLPRSDDGRCKMSTLKQQRHATRESLIALDSGNEQGLPQFWPHPFVPLSPLRPLEKNEARYDVPLGECAPTSLRLVLAARTVSPLRTP